MKRMNKFVYALLIGCVLLTGCSSNTASTESSNEVVSDSQANASITDEEVPAEANSPAETSSESNYSTVTGRIESIEESTITLSVMNMPDGNGGQKPDGNGGQKPDGQTPDGEVPKLPDNAETTTFDITDTTVIYDESGSAITIDSLSEGTMITAEMDESGNAVTIRLSSPPESMGAMGGPGGSQSAPASYEAAITYSEDTGISDENYTSTGTDENAILINNQAKVSLTNATIDRTSSDSTGGDSSSFYGIGAAVLVTDGTLELNGSNITTDASGAAGVFAYGNGIANVSDTTIKTSKDTSGGIHVAGGGTLHASNLTVETDGASAAAVRSDRGGGTMTIDGGSYTSNGSGSPAVYCTADITINDAVLTATGSEAVCIEGLNSLTLTNCDLSGDMPESEQNDCTWTVILYQSMSGDSEAGNSTFHMTGGSLTSNNGGLFYTTNTESTFYLSDVDISYSENNDFFLKCTGNANARGWGQSGENGADCIFTADHQEMKGNIIWDSISDLDFEMTNQSTLIGAFIQDESNAGNGGDGHANLTIDENSTWIVTGDSTLTTLTCKGLIEDADGNSVTIKDNNGNTLIKGNSKYTITVETFTE